MGYQAIERGHHDNEVYAGWRVAQAHLCAATPRDDSQPPLRGDPHETRQFFHRPGDCHGGRHDAIDGVIGQALFGQQRRLVGEATKV